MGMLKKLLMFLMVIYIAVCFNQNMFSQTTTKKKPQELEKKNTPPREKPSFKNYWKKDMLTRQAASFNLTNSSGTSLFYVQDDGKVGIGTMSPNEKLEVAGTISSTTGGIKFPDGSLQTTAATGNGGNTLDQAYDQGGAGLGRTITADAGAVNIVGPVGLTTTGWVGIGTTQPQNRLDVNGNIQISNSSIPMGLITEVRGTTPLLNMSLNFREPNKNSAYRGAAFRIDSRGGVYSLFQWLYRTAGSNDETVIMTLTEAGRLGIGTDNPTHELTVNGTVKAEELILSPSGADFVFEDDYKLRSLDKVEAYIQENKRLPEIPSAEEMEKDGVGTGKFQSKLLQKVEELTLYLIEMKKNQDAQSNRLKVLEEENRALKNRIAFLERIKQQEGD